MNDYLELKRRHQEEINAFPMAFAFNKKQFAEGMIKLGLEPTDTDKIFKFGDTGGFYRREHSEALISMLDRHEQEKWEAIHNDTTGEGFIFQMFDYELANHEYIITGQVDDTLRAVGISPEEVEKTPQLKHGLEKAQAAQFEHYGEA